MPFAAKWALPCHVVWHSRHQPGAGSHGRRYNSRAGGDSGRGYRDRRTHAETDPLTVAELADAAEAWARDRQSQDRGPGHCADRRKTCRKRCPGCRRKTGTPATAELAKVRGALFDRYSIVVDSWEKKGGDDAAMPSSRLPQLDHRRGDPHRGFQDPGDVRWPGRQLKTAASRRPRTLRWWSLPCSACCSLQACAAGREPLPSSACESVETAAGVPCRRRLLDRAGLRVDDRIVGARHRCLAGFALVGGASFIMAFAFQDTLGNLASGLMIMINRPFDEGHYVDIGGVNRHGESGQHRRNHRDHARQPGDCDPEQECLGETSSPMSPRVRRGASISPSVSATTMTSKRHKACSKKSCRHTPWC